MTPVTLAGVGKRYRKYTDTAVLVARGRDRIRRTTRSEIWALRGIDLEVEPRECLGVIGRNGGGKTTMLQLLAGVSAPTEGRVSIRGRVAPLMAAGVGFHPELTGRENVYVNGTILGMERSEIDAGFGDILAFSDIGDFIDTPVKFYSSGMMVRLGMSVALRSRPNILLVDEVLAVGDIVFQARCFERMQEIREAGATVIVVSHNLNAIRNLCDRTMLLNKGRVEMLGDTVEAISRFHQLLDEHREPEQSDAEEVAADGTGAVRSVEMLDRDGTPTASFAGGDTATVVVHVSGPATGVELVVSSGGGLTIYREVLATSSSPAGEAIRVQLPIHLPTGTYRVVARRPEVSAPDDERGASFFVKSRPRMFGHADLAAEFSRAAAHR